MAKKYYNTDAATFAISNNSQKCEQEQQLDICKLEHTQPTVERNEKIVIKLYSKKHHTDKLNSEQFRALAIIFICCFYTFAHTLSPSDQRIVAATLLSCCCCAFLFTNVINYVNIDHRSSAFILCGCKITSSSSSSSTSSSSKSSSSSWSSFLFDFAAARAKTEKANTHT